MIFSGLVEIARGKLMSIEERPVSLDRPSLPRADEEGIRPLVSLDERIIQFQAEMKKKFEESKVLRDPLASDLQACSFDGINDAANVLGGWREIGTNIQAGAGRFVEIKIGVEKDGSKSDFKIPLDDIGDKKGKILSNGTQIKFVQTNATFYNSEYELQWTAKKGGYNFSWK